MRKCGGKTSIFVHENETTLYVCRYMPYVNICSVYQRKLLWVGNRKWVNICSFSCLIYSTYYTCDDGNDWPCIENEIRWKEFYVRGRHSHF